MRAAIHAYRFGPYEIRVHTREIFKQGIRLKLRPQSFRILEVLVECAGEVVTREELRQKVWPAETFVDFEHGLNTSVKDLRRVLADSPSEPRYIETLPRLGYRLIVPVTADEPTIGAVTAEPVAGAGRDGQPGTDLRLGQPRGPEQIRKPDSPKGLTIPTRTLLVVGASLLLVAAIAVWGWLRVRSPKQTPGGRVMLAVLPFQNLTGDSTQDYMTDGLTEEMIGKLGRLNPARLGVIARTSVMHYKGVPARIAQIGRELGVQYILEGSARKQGYSLRVSARLIRVKDETHAWAREYNRELGGLLTLQGEIAQELSDEIQITLGDHPASHPVKNDAVSPQQSEAYDLYLKGLYFWNKRTTNDFWRAIEYYKRAIAKSPNHAPSYAGMADCYAMIGGYSAEPRPEFMSKARSAALRALEIDPNLPEAHAALAVIVRNYDHDWQTAGNEFRRAIELNPSYATAHHWYAEHLGYLARFDEAFRESERARQLDPLSLIIAADNGVLLIYSRQYDRAIQKCRSVLDLDPNFNMAEGCVARAYKLNRMFPEALRVYEAASRDFADPRWKWSDMAYIYGRAGQRQQALRAFAKVRQLYRPQQTDPTVFVWVYLGLANKDETFAWLEKAYAQHSNSMVTLKVDPIYDPLRSDPRFQDLLRRVGLTE